MAIDTSARPSGSPTYPLDVFAALSADRRTMAISVVNPTETPQECDLTLAGVAGQRAREGLPADRAAGRQRRRRRPVRGRMFSGPPATMAESSLPQAPRRVTLPPTSLTVYAFDVTSNRVEEAKP